MRIPFNRPATAGDEFDYMRAAVDSGHISSSGTFSQRATELLSDALDGAHVLLTTSCTDALEMTALLAEVGPGDSVVVPSFTFVSTALAFARQGATIKFCDIERDTLGLDPDHLESLLDPTVKAIVPVHYAGMPCRIDDILKIVASYPAVSVVEDNAHALFATLRGQPLGTFGRFATLSFHETKNFTCGEGGALILNDPADIDRAHILLDKGTNRQQFLNGAVDKYTWVDTGSSFGLSDLLAAYLLAQLERSEEVLAKRRAVHERYWELLEPYASAETFSLPFVPTDCEPAWHMFYVLLPDNEIRDRVLEQMRDADIFPTFHYVPLHSAPGGRNVSGDDTSCPVTDEISGRLMRLPFYNEITTAQIDRVAEVFLRVTRAL